jgi:hypothetical protein
MAFARLTNAVDDRAALVRTARVQAILETEDGGSHLLLTAGVSVLVRESPEAVLRALEPEAE